MDIIHALRFVATALLQQRQAMQDKLRDIENTPTVAERRTCPRFRVTSFIYIDIGSVRGGIVTSLSEKGLALTFADALGNTEFGDGPLRMHIQFPGTPGAVEASGEIIWTSPSGKEARVRFVEVGDKTREQIRRWISDQASNNELRPDPPTLPEMKLPSSAKAKARGPRFSFADVASSRVDSEDETGTEIEEFPEIAGEPDELPPSQAQGLTFAEASEVVFTEDQAEKTQSLRNEQKTQASPDEKLPRQPFLSAPERRQHSRRQILLFTYAVLGEDNGGLVFNLGEGGLAITAAEALQERHFAKIRVRFPDSEDWIETSGRLAWKNDSGKEAGIEFADLAEDVRARIREWVSQEETPGLQSGEDETRTRQGGVLELPSLMELEGPSAEPFEIPASFEEQSFEGSIPEEHRFEKRASTSVLSSPALFKTGVKGILERASVRKPVAKIKTPRVTDHSVAPRTRVARRAGAIAAGVALAVGSWMLLQRGSLKEAIAVITQNVSNPQPSHETAPNSAIAKTGAGTVGATADPPVPPSENAAAQTGTSKLPPQQIEKGSPEPIAPGASVATTIAKTERTLKAKPRSEESALHFPASSSAPRSLDRTQRTAPLQREQEAKTPQITASASAPASGRELVENKSAPSKSVETKLPESTPAQVAQALPTINTNKPANTAPSTLNSTPPQPPAAPPVNVEKEKRPIAPKQPEPVLARTPVVAVSFDPFPSILMPKTEKSKKSRQGKSLQMGSLISRVDPVYPEEAKEQGVEGTVRVHAIFNREGAVRSVISVSGPPSLVLAAMNAVRQWRYSQTILGGQAMETEEDVTVLFRLANSADKN